MKRSWPHRVLVEGEPRKVAFFPLSQKGRKTQPTLSGGLPGVATVRGLGGGS